ncbi:Na+/H+ antiporter NhaA [Actinomycetospora cinnamomea]|uniref:Na+/H+ antiporter NhaA n=1 Tax=Actinomycetospora cinnamomea TaxID=663609 RepID=UPI003C2B22E8
MSGDAAGGVALVLAALVALVWANSPWQASYGSFWGFELMLGIDAFSVTEDLQHWVNDGLMVIFFFVVGLEIKRELVRGELRDPRASALPAVAAVGGVLVPALLFLAFTAGTEGAAGWGIPMATDIAFAVGVLALLGSRVPAGAKLLLLTVAIVDDIIAITVIAIFYSDSISALWLAAAVLGLGLVVLMRRLGITAIWAYVPVGLVVWLCTLESGVHATIAGVALALLTPAGRVGGRPVLDTLEHRLSPISAFAVVPLFAIANAGVVLAGDTLQAAATSPVALGIAVGLVVGKVVGVSGGIALMVRTGWGHLPEGVTTRHAVGVAALAGIGFTVSLFIAELAYADPALVETAKIGIFAGSLLAGLVGAAVLGLRRRRRGGGADGPSAGPGPGAVSGSPA